MKTAQQILEEVKQQLIKKGHNPALVEKLAQKIQTTETGQRPGKE